MYEKRLRKSKNRKIFGVCGGIAEYFDIDPVIVRLIWAIAICCFGTGLLLYIVAAIVMDD
jgi:phage shock protein PspC (stress-responsive transcriptional regulator)